MFDCQKRTQSACDKIWDINPIYFPYSNPITSSFFWWSWVSHISIQREIIHIQLYIYIYIHAYAIMYNMYIWIYIIYIYMSTMNYISIYHDFKDKPSEATPFNFSHSLPIPGSVYSWGDSSEGLQVCLAPSRKIPLCRGHLEVHFHFIGGFLKCGYPEIIHL